MDGAVFPLRTTPSRHTGISNTLGRMRNRQSERPRWRACRACLAQREANPLHARMAYMLACARARQGDPVRGGETRSSSWRMQCNAERVDSLRGCSWVVLCVREWWLVLDGLRLLCCYWTSEGLRSNKSPQAVPFPSR